MLTTNTDAIIQIELLPQLGLNSASSAWSVQPRAALPITWATSRSPDFFAPKPFPLKTQNQDSKSDILVIMTVVWKHQGSVGKE
jgi:hypothetical protein